MEIFYGYERSDKVPQELGIKRAYIDTHQTRRSERADMFATGVRDGVTVVVLSESDLGRGAEIAQMRDQIAKAGASIRVESGTAADPKPAGRPKLFDPTPDQDKQIKALYRDYFTMSHVLSRASDIVGHEVKRHQLVHRYGKRWDRDKLEGEADG